MMGNIVGRFIGYSIILGSFAGLIFLLIWATPVLIATAALLFVIWLIIQLAN